MRILIAGLIAAVAIPVAQLRAETSELWTNDIEAAMQTAAEQKKHLLLDFTGSDWCGWCIRLHDEVFSKEEFQKYASQKFVLVELDFPRDESKVPPEIKKQNEKWKEKLGVRGFPSIFLCTADGEAYAKTGYQQGGAENYVQHLSGLVSAKDSIDKLKAELAEATGDRKAQVIDQLLTAAGNQMLVDDKPAMMKQIIELDAENKLGLRKKYEVVVRVDEARDLANSGKLDEAKASVDKTIKEFGAEGESSQQLLYLKAQILLSSQSFDEAIGTLDAAVKAAPETQMAAGLKQLKQRVELFMQQQAAEKKKSAEKTEDKQDE